jgi:hypothetical protein
VKVPNKGPDVKHGKRRLNFSQFTRKERLVFPIENGYHIDLKN